MRKKQVRISLGILMKLFNQRKDIVARHPKFCAFVLCNLWRTWKNGDEVKVQIISEGEVKEEAILSLRSEDIKMLEELRQSL